MINTGNRMFDIYMDEFDSLVTGGQITPAWSPDGKLLAFVEGPAEHRRAWLVELVSGDKQELVEPTLLREEIRRVTGQTPPGQGVPFAYVAFAGPRTISTHVGETAVTIDLDTGTVTKAPAESLVDTLLGFSASARTAPREYWRSQPLMDPGKERETVSPDGQFLVSTRDGNIVLRSSYDGRETLLTTDGTAEHEWRFDMYNPMLESLGMAVPVTNWSPDGTRLAAYKVDNTGVAQAPQVHYLKRQDEVIHRYHGKAGGVLERYTLHLLDIYGKPQVTVDLGDTTDTYPCFAGWLPDGSEVLIFQMSRDCRRVDILAADTVTGEVRELFSETGDTFVRIHHDVYYGRKLGLWLTPDGQRILWLSERDGWQHLYSYDLQGKPLCQLTSGAWAVDAVKRIDSSHVWFTARHDQARPYDQHLCRVPLAGGEVQRLTDDPGVHTPIFSPAGEIFIDTYSTHDKPPVSFLRRSDDGISLTELSTADTTDLERVGWIPPEQFTVTAADGETELWGVMYFPHDFDAARSYPLVEFVYGGPQIAVAPHSWSSAFARFARAIAQLGCVAVLLDGRGTPGRSKAFHDATYRSFAGVLADDHAAAIQQLAERHDFIDGNRVGVNGHSWGGYSAFRLLADRPDVYKAAISSAPGFDPYSSVLYECYLGLPQQDRQPYDAANVLLRASQVQGAFMIVCGSSDHATWSDAMKMSEALIRAGKDHDFVPLPEQYHGYDTAHDSFYWRKAAAFYAAHLGGVQ